MDLARPLPPLRLGLSGWALAALAALAPGGARAAPEVTVLAWEEQVSVGAPGVAEPGETGSLVVTVTLRGPDRFTALSGHLVLVAPPAGVSLVSDSTSWPPMEPGDSAPDVGGLIVSLDASAPCGEELAFDLELREAGVAFATVPLVVRIGDAYPVALPSTEVARRTSESQVVFWNGSEYGVAWRFENLGGDLVGFQRMTPNGSPIGAELVLPTTPGRADGGPALSWGDGRWMIARPDDMGVRVAFIDAGGNLLSQHRVVTWADPGQGTWNVTAAWDGVGWGIAFHDLDAMAGPERLRGFTWVHVLPDGTVDAGPITFDTAHQVQPSRQPIAWTGSAHAVLPTGSDGSSLYLLDRSGSLVAPERPVPLLGLRPKMAWNGRSLGVAVSDGYSVSYFALSPEGDVLAPPVLVAPARVLDGGIYTAYLPQLSLAWDGTGFGISLSVRDSAPLPGAPIFWASFVRVDERGRIRTPLQVVSEPAPGWPHWSAGEGATFNPERGEHAFLAIGTLESAAAESQAGVPFLQRLRLDAGCASGPPPREVSAPGSGSPLFVARALDSPPFAWLDLHFEDIGNEATAYHVYELSRSRDGMLIVVDSPTCRVVPGTDPDLAPDGPGRWRLRARRWQLQPLRPDFVSVAYLLVSAANENGEGIRGRDSFGLDRPPLNGCGWAP